MAFLGEHLENFIQMLSKFPGLGPRSAKRIALYLMKHKMTLLSPLIERLRYLAAHYRPCPICGYFDERSPCFFCTSPTRQPSVICVVADTGDVWALEKAGVFKGRYHILGGLLSSFQGHHPEELHLDQLVSRLDNSVQEVILALNSNMEGQTTLHYVASYLSQQVPSLKISTLARGMPMGGEVDYLDQGTLMSAFLGRKSLPEISLQAVAQPLTDEHTS